MNPVRYLKLVERIVRESLEKVPYLLILFTEYICINGAIVRKIHS